MARASRNSAPAAARFRGSCRACAGFPGRRCAATPARRRTGRGAGLGRAHGKDVDERPAHRELAVLVDGIGGAVTGPFERAPQGFAIDAVADPEAKGVAGNESRRRQALHQHGRRGHQDTPARVRQLAEGTQAVGDDVLVGRKQVVGQGLPIGQMQDRDVAIAQKEPQLRFQLLRRARIGGHRQYQAGTGARGPGDRQRRRRPVQAPQWRRSPGALAGGMARNSLVMTGCGGSGRALYRRNGRVAHGWCRSPPRPARARSGRPSLVRHAGIGAILRDIRMQTVSRGNGWSRR